MEPTTRVSPTWHPAHPPALAGVDGGVAFDPSPDDGSLIHRRRRNERPAIDFRLALVTRHHRHQIKSPTFCECQLLRRLGSLFRHAARRPAPDTSMRVFTRHRPRPSMSNGIPRLKIIHSALHGARLELFPIAREFTSTHDRRSLTKHEILAQSFFAISQMKSRQDKPASTTAPRRHPATHHGRKRHAARHGLRWRSRRSRRRCTPWGREGVGSGGRCEGAHVRVRVWGQDTRDGATLQGGMPRYLRAHHFGVERTHLQLARLSCASTSGWPK